MGIWGDFQGLTEATGGGRGVKKFENWGDVVYGWSLTHLNPSIAIEERFCSTFEQVLLLTAPHSSDL